jgi:hypothetical protein
MVDPIPEDEHVATLVHQDEFGRNASQVASLSTTRILFVKRKELALKPFELVDLPMNRCTEITYSVKWAVVAMALGATLVLLVIFIFSSVVPAGTSVPVGALAIAFVFGAILMRGPKRHRLTFIVDGKRYRWQSKAGDFKYKVASVNKVIAFAQSQGILNTRAK